MHIRYSLLTLYVSRSCLYIHTRLQIIRTCLTSEIANVCVANILSSLSYFCLSCVERWEHVISNMGGAGQINRSHSLCSRSVSALTRDCLSLSQDRMRAHANRLTPKPRPSKWSMLMASGETFAALKEIR